MTIIDPSTALGQCRLRCADFGDIPYLPDSVYLQALADNSNNVAASSKICATFILGTLAFKTHRKIGLSLECWGGEAFTAYKEFLILTITNPAFMDISPLPVSSVESNGVNPLVDFQNNWNRNFFNSTSGQELAANADISPNSGDRTGTLGDSSGWSLNV